MVIEYGNKDKYEGTVSILGSFIQRNEGNYFSKVGIYTYANGDELEGKFIDDDGGLIKG